MSDSHISPTPHDVARCCFTDARALVRAAQRLLDAMEQFKEQHATNTTASSILHDVNGAIYNLESLVNSISSQLVPEEVRDAN